MRNPRWVLAGWIFLLVFASWGVSRLKVETSTESLLNKQDSEWAFYQSTSLPLFGGDEVIVVAIEAGESFDRETLESVKELTAALERLPQVRRVDSLSSVPLIRVELDGTVNLGSALARELPDSPAARRALQTAIGEDRLASHTLVSEDGLTFAINVLPTEGADFEVLVSSIKEVTNRYKVRISGVPIFRLETSSRTQAEILLFIPLTIITMMVFLSVVFRSARAVFIPLLVSGVGTWVVLGALGISGTPLTATTVILPPVLLALGTAYTMHLVTAAVVAPPEDLEAVLKAVAEPVSFSALTTALGFLSMSIVQIDSIRFVAIYGSVGVLAVLLATLTIAPILLQNFVPRDRIPPAISWIRRTLQPALIRASRARISVLVGWSGLFVLAAIGVGKLRIESNVVLWFMDGTEVRDSYEYIRAKLSGISPLNVVIQSTTDVPVTSKEVLNAIDELSRHLETLESVGKTISIADPIHQLHQGFVGEMGPPNFPKDEALIEQYLLLLASVDALRDVMAEDQMAANVLIRANANGSAELIRISEEVDAWWKVNGAHGFSARTSGIMLQFARAQDEIAYGQLRGLLIAFVTIGGVLIIVLRNASAALLALVPNVVPIFIAFGAMGWLGIPLDAGTVFLGSLALGIAVDDTIHFVMAFVSETRQGLKGEAALGGAFQRILPAISLTTMAVGLGFLVLGFSTFLFVRNLGLLTSSLMLLCLLADVSLLALLSLVVFR